MNRSQAKARLREIDSRLAELDDARFSAYKDLVVNYKALARVRSDKVTLTRQREIENKDRLIPPHMVWLDQPDYLAAREKYGDVVGIPEARCYFLQSSLKSLAGVEGDVAECGVRNGKSSLYMLSVAGPERKFHLFDSFEGISDPRPELDKIDTAFIDGGEHRAYRTDDEKATRARLSEYGKQVRIYKGWIPEKFRKVSDQKFCLVHIDVDLYDPTIQSLEFFYDRLSPGGMIICDDYGSGHFPGARQAMDDFFRERRETPIEVPQGQGFIIKRG